MRRWLATIVAIVAAEIVTYAELRQMFAESRHK